MKKLSAIAAALLVLTTVFTPVVNGAPVQLVFLSVQQGQGVPIGAVDPISLGGRYVKRHFVKLEISRDNGVTYAQIGTLDGTVGNVFSWLVTGPATTTAILRASTTQGRKIVTVLSPVFTIKVPDGIGTITTDQLADGAVTNPKLANFAVTSDKISSGASSSGFVLTSNGLGGTDWTALANTSGAPINGTPIGAGTAAPGTFTTLTAMGNFTVSGTSTFGGPAIFNGTMQLPTAPNSITGGGAGTGLNADLLDGLDSAALVQKSGATMSGALILNADPVDSLGAATKQYVDAHVGTVNTVTTTVAQIISTGTFSDITGATDTFVAGPNGATVVATFSATVSAATLPVLGTGLATIRLTLDSGAQNSDQSVVLLLANQGMNVNVTLIANLTPGSHTIKAQLMDGIAGLLPVSVSNTSLTKTLTQK